MVTNSIFQTPLYCPDSTLPGQFEYSLQSLTTVDGGLGALLWQLGYLSNMWEQLCAPVRSGESVIRQFQKGYGKVDMLATGDTKRCSAAEIEILSHPYGTNLEFDPPQVLMLGKCGFFRGSQPLQGDNPRQVISVSGGGGMGARPDPGLNVPPQPARPAWGDQRTTGMVPIAWGYDLPPVVATGIAIGTGISIAVGGRLSGGTSSVQAENFHYPLKYINFQKSLWLGDRPDATGFWWKLKPGVIANIYVYGAELKHNVKFGGGGGEFPDQGEFNPMKCGTLLQFN